MLRKSLSDNGNGKKTNNLKKTKSPQTLKRVDIKSLSKGHPLLQ